MITTRTPTRKFRRIFVQDAEALAALIPEIESQSVMAVDIEMGQRVDRRPGGLQEWIHILALIQLAGGDLSIVLDPLRCSPLPLKHVMAGSTRKVFLGGGQDAALLAKAGIPPVNIVDVGEVALALYGRREDGMAALSRRIFGISLDKTVRRADWMIRPLNPTLLAYGYQDAELTLQIYDWFDREHTDVLRMHERPLLDEALPFDSPEWLQLAVTRPAADVLAILMEYSLDPAEHAAEFASAIRGPLAGTSAPRLANRLLRVAGELRLVALLPDVLPLVDSPSGLIRGSAARAIGLLAEKEEGEPILKRLLADPIDDVKKAAEAGLRDLKARRSPEDDEDDEADEPTLAGDALAALQALKARMEEQG